MKKVICVVLITMVLIAGYHYCYHLDGQHCKLGDNYTTLEMRLTDFFGNTIATWEKRVDKPPMGIVVYEKWF